MLIKEIVYERRFGISTSKMKISSSTEFYHYQGASYKVLLMVFKDMINETTGFQFLDIGCGKGRAVFVAEFCGYNDLSGIDLDKDLILEATENLKTYKFKRPDSNVEFVFQNALEFEYSNEPTVYFLFNPFSESVLAQVLNRICSMNKHEMIFVYMNPLFPKLFRDSGMTEVKTYKSSRYIEAIVFKRGKSS